MTDLIQARTKPSVPQRMLWLPHDPDRPHFHVPWFVPWVDGKPEYRAMTSAKIAQAVKEDLCWLCGKRLGSVKAFVIGPMCAVNRTSAEPPSHVECAEYAVKVCPFLSHPKMIRNEKNLPQNDGMAGFGLKRNPGVTLIWKTKSYQTFRAYAGGDGILFTIGEPNGVSWWSEGRPAARQEVLSSIDSGLPSLAQMCDGPGDSAELSRRYESALLLLPQEAS